MELAIAVSNPDGVQKGVKAVTVDGVPVGGPMVPLDKLADGCQVKVVME